MDHPIYFESITNKIVVSMGAKSINIRWWTKSKNSCYLMYF